MDLYQLLMMTNARLALEIMDQDVRALFRQLPQLEDRVRTWLARQQGSGTLEAALAGQDIAPGIVEFLCDGCHRHEHQSHWEPVSVGTYGRELARAAIGLCKAHGDFPDVEQYARVREVQR